RSVRFHTEPMPVSTPQPMRRATERSTSSSIFTHWLAWTTEYSEKKEAPAKFHAGSPARVKGWLALPRLFRHRAGWPVTQYLQRPQNASVCSTTWSPGFTLVTASPTSYTMPAPSWPSTHGYCHGIVPSITEMSLWHSPAATTCTFTSVGPGARTSRSSRISAFSPSKTSPSMSSLPLSRGSLGVGAYRRLRAGRHADGLGVAAGAPHG